MSDSFNGYHVWLGIPTSEQPPNHYRLLGITPFETDLDVIDHAADRQMAHVRTFQSGRNGALSQRILNELAAARVCLLHAERKAEYDDSLRAKLSSASHITAVPVGKAVPVAQPIAPMPPAAPGKSGISKSAYALPPNQQLPNQQHPRGTNPAVPSPPAGGQGPAPTAVPVARSSELSESPRSVPPKLGAGKTATGKNGKQGSDANGDGDDPFGLSASNTRRPVIRDDDHAVQGINRKVGNVDLSLKSSNRDALIQKSLILGFIAVAVVVVIMVGLNFVKRTYGPLDQLFVQPPIEEPEVASPKPIVAPAAPLPAPSKGEAESDAAAADLAAPAASDSPATLEVPTDLGSPSPTQPLDSGTTAPEAG